MWVMELHDSVRLINRDLHGLESELFSGVLCCPSSNFSLLLRGHPFMDTYNEKLFPSTVCSSIVICLLSTLTLSRPSAKLMSLAT